MCQEQSLGHSSLGGVAGQILGAVYHQFWHTEWQQEKHSAHKTFWLVAYFQSLRIGVYIVRHFPRDVWC